MADAKGQKNGGDGRRVHCPRCQNERVWRDGKYKKEDTVNQRYRCRNCGFRFIEATGFSSSSKRKARHQVCDGRSKNLIVANVENTATGDISQYKQISELETWLRKNGIKNPTIVSKSKLLKQMVRRGIDLNDPEAVKEYISVQKWCDGRKRNAVHAYSSLLKMKGLTWDAPIYESIAKVPWIPQELEVDQLIAGTTHRTATFLQLLKETAMRPGEAWSLKWKDVDTESKNVIVTPEKGSRSRRLKISDKLIAMLYRLPRKNDYVFGNGMLNHFSDCFRKQRKKIAYKLGNQRLLQISFKTLRHYKASMEYKRTHDIYHVKLMLGHVMIKNTEIYTHVIEFPDDEWISKTARTVEEAKALVEAGFEYVCTTIDGYMLFRIRK